MIVIAGYIQMDPDKREPAEVAAREMMEATRREPGCISYTMSADLSDRGRFYIFEEWKDGAALDAHFAAPHMARFREAAAGLGIREMKVQRYEVASVAPLGG